nr:OadG family protein [Clostridia bacterium]
MIYNNIASVLALASGMGSSIDTSVPISERLGIGLELLIVGMGTVFSVLLILWGVLALFKVFFYDMKNKDAKPAEKKPEPKPAAPTAAPEPVQPAAQADDGELIAAITAAVAAYLDAEAQAQGLPQCDTKFRVVSFRRAGRR